MYRVKREQPSSNSARSSRDDMPASAARVLQTPETDRLQAMAHRQSSNPSAVAVRSMQSSLDNSTGVLALTDAQERLMNRQVTDPPVDMEVDDQIADPNGMQSEPPLNGEPEDPPGITPEDPYTDTDGSDTDDDTEYQTSADRQAVAKNVSDQVEKFIKQSVIKKKLTSLINILDSNTPIEEKKESIGKAILKSSKKKPRKYGEFDHSKPHRKSGIFKIPSVPVGKRAELHEPPTAEAKADLENVNAMLPTAASRKNSPNEIKIDDPINNFLVAQYRGLFYSKIHFHTQEDRKAFRKTNHIDRPVFSTNVLNSGDLGIKGYYELAKSADSGDQAAAEHFKEYTTELLKRSKEVQKIFARMREEPYDRSHRATVKDETGMTPLNPENMSDINIQLYSGNYGRYGQLLKKAIEKKASDHRTPEQGGDRPVPLPLPANPGARPEQGFSLLRSLEDFSNPGNPILSTGDVPVHATRYAFGLKPYTGQEQHVLEPEYDAKGRPRHPYSGLTIASVHPLPDYMDGKAQQLVTLQGQGRINLPKVIIAERETQFYGHIPENRVKVVLNAKFPNFEKNYKHVYLEKYGLTGDEEENKGSFSLYKDAITKTQQGSLERIFIESNLTHFLAVHQEQRAQMLAHNHAKAQAARLVYRTGEASFGFTPLPLPARPEEANAEPAASTVNLKKRKHLERPERDLRDGDDADAGDIMRKLPELEEGDDQPLLQPAAGNDVGGMEMNDENPAPTTDGNNRMNHAKARKKKKLRHKDK